MSIIRCQRCDYVIDSDDDPECLVNDGDLIACESCRARMEYTGELNVETNKTVTS